MNGYERISASVQGRRPDRVPVMLHNFLMAADEAGYTQGQYRVSAAAMADSHARAVERYGYDGVMLEMDTAVVAGALGVPVAFPEEEPARTVAPLLARVEDVRSLPPPRVEGYRHVQTCLQAVRLLVERFRGEIYVRGNCDQLALSLATMVCGAAEFYMDLCYPEKEGWVHELLEWCTQAALQYIRLMAQTGCDMVSNGDSPAGPDLISPEMYERFALPYEKRVVEEAHRLGLPYALHICGDTTRILEAMIRTGTDCLELDYKTDTAAAHAALKDRVTLIGNIDPSGVLRWGDVRKVEEATRALCRAFADTPRFILNAGCAIPQGTPSDNIRALVRVAYEFGG
jgi:MtaA/CmuA family methyltransferase